MTKTNPVAPSATDAPSMALTPISRARQMLAEATTIPALRELHDYAIGVKAWAKARDLGVDAENEASEVILRAERAMGEAILGMRAAGLLRAVGGDYVKTSTLDRSGATLSEVLDLPEKQANKRAAEYRSLASLSQTQFDYLLCDARDSGKRLAKVNFYTAVARASGKTHYEKPETPTDGHFEGLRRGVYGLLGWRIESDGRSSWTRNGMLTLPDDELAQMATFIRALADAYNEAKRARD